MLLDKRCWFFEGRSRVFEDGTSNTDIGERWYSSTIPFLGVLRQTTRFTFFGLFNRVLSSNVSYKEIRSQVNDHELSPLQVLQWAFVSNLLVTLPTISKFFMGFAANLEILFNVGHSRVLRMSPINMYKLINAEGISLLNEIVGLSNSPSPCFPRFLIQ